MNIALLDNINKLFIIILIRFICINFISSYLKIRYIYMYMLAILKAHSGYNI